MNSPFHWIGFRGTATLALAAGLTAFLGCDAGDGLERVAISGSVKLDGQPLSKGMIQFLPDSSGQHALMVGGEIKGGAYSIPQAEGPVPGLYKVSISSEGAPGGPEEGGSMPGTGPVHAKELIPPQYNQQTTLSAKIDKDGTKTFDFALEKAAAKGGTPKKGN